MFILHEKKNNEIHKGGWKLKVIINLDDSILDLVQQKADDDDRSRKQMLELIIKRAVQWLRDYIVNMGGNIEMGSVIFVTK